MANSSATFVTVRTNFSPAITFNPTQKDTSPVRSSLLKILQPSIDATIPVLGNTHFAPYGEPSGYGLVLFGAVIGLAAFGLYKLLK